MKAAGASQFTGCDLSEGVLNVARVKRPGMRPLQHDITQPLPWDLGEIDAFQVCLTLEHMSGSTPLPAHPHQFETYVNAFSALSLRVLECRERRPRDFGVAPPLKALKRGADFPLVVEFTLTKS
jgi:malonyl-CoA O-methyltransferase